MYAPDEWLTVRLSAELAELEQIRCPAIAFRRPGAIPFTRLYVTYHIRSVVGLDAQGEPLYRDRHDLVIDIPPEYPELAPVVRMVAGSPPPFHPNFWSHGANYGLVCTHGGGIALADPGETLALLVVRVGQMLQYDPQLIQVHQGPNDEAARWYHAHRNQPGLFPTDRQVLPLPGRVFQE